VGTSLLVSLPALDCDSSALLRNTLPEQVSLLAGYFYFHLSTTGMSPKLQWPQKHVLAATKPFNDSQNNAKNN